MKEHSKSAAFRTSEAPKTILITNTVALNGGDAAILQALIFLLKQTFGSQTEFIVYDSSPQVASRYYPDIRFRELVYFRALSKSSFGLVKSVVKRWNVARMRLALAAWHRFPKFAHLLLTIDERNDFINYQNADLVVSTGGTYLVDHYSLKPRIFDFELSLRMQRPLILFTQSLGPFTKQRRSTRSKLRRILARARLILLRDERSLRNLRDLGLSATHCRISADAVFALGNPSVVKSAANSNSLKGPCMRIAVSVRAWRRFAGVSRKRGMENYRRAVKDLTVHLVAHYRAEVIFISTCQGIPEYQSDDSAIARQIWDSLPPESQACVQVNRDFHSPQSLIAELGNFDLAIGTRMHFCILSLLAGVPVFPIAYEFKANELFSRLGLGEWVQNIESLAAPGLMKTFDEFVAALPKIRPTLFARVELEAESARRSGLLVKAAVEAQGRNH